MLMLRSFRAEETCNAVDDDRDDEIDVRQIFYYDNDGEGRNPCWGRGLRTVGRVADGTDCDDTNAEIFPGAVDVQRARRRLR